MCDLDPFTKIRSQINNNAVGVYRYCLSSKKNYSYQVSDTLGEDNIQLGEL